MPVVAALLDDRAALVSLRRALPRGGPRLVACRTPQALERHLEQRLTDAIVLHPARLGDNGTASLTARFPGIPILAFGAFRPDDARLLIHALDVGAAAIAVADVDDAILGELLARISLTARRRDAMADAVRVLRLDDAMQRQAWERLVTDVDRPLRTAELAERLGVSREHLSRQFGAGGAPNLKRVIDLTRVATASQLLQNPGYSPRTAAQLLGFSSAAHLNSTALRIAGVGCGGLARLGPHGVLAHFVRGKMRSRG
jgi:AraC-like DNA-binding protein